MKDKSIVDFDKLIISGNIKEISGRGVVKKKIPNNKNSRPIAEPACSVDADF